MQQSTQYSNSILNEIFQLLPHSFAELARHTKALQRKRKIKNAEQLLRLVFLYCGLDFSLKKTAATLTALFEKISDTACLSD